MDKSKSKFLWIGAVIIILIIAGFLVFSNNNNSKQVSVYTCSDGTPVASPEECVQRALANDDTKYGEVYGTNTPNKTPAPEKHAKIEIISSNVQSDETFGQTGKKIIGEVKNTGEVNAEFIKIVATFYDANNQIIGTAYTYASIDNLKINQTSPFEISSYEVPDSFSTFKLQPDWQDA